ncbi:MAG: spermidine/putrescine ABC transporter substrate-binding protein [Planctomycetia bacterium]|nr:spermidine/putrescine ABC transporter substrate-binding protein [Planctomycetia bacterium]
MKKSLSGMFLNVVCALFCVSALVVLSGCSGENSTGAKKVLHFYTWVDYIDPEVVEEFEERFQCEVKIDYFDSNEAMLAKIKSSNVGYDVILPTTYMVEVMKQEQLIQKLNPELVPNRKFIDPVVAEKLGDPNCEYSVPYYEGFTGLGYNKKEVGDKAFSWRVFEDAALARRVSLLDDMRESIGAALIVLGYDINTTDDAQLNEARDLLIQWKKNIAKFGVDDVKQGLDNGEFFVIHGYSGDILQYANENPNIQFAVPREGAIVSYDHFVISSASAEPELANEFINFMCLPENAARNIQTTFFNVPVPEAQKQVPEEMRALPGFMPSAEDIARAHVVRDLGADNKKFSRVWDEVKAAE